MRGSPALRLQAEAVFSGRKGSDKFLEYEFKDNKGTAHGHAARPNLNIPEAREAHEKAFQKAVDWFTSAPPV
ncbi:putative dienelactone hydrolase endo-1,3,1,4-beta-D-glucanase [Lyophyllum shimeji]|uniref:Dienelactone hydrolase endo-1,3,1,4-beta-D-glucanase n=1 Tax=Lyophyllum shimeji TaxID=47721 RepID=A0A9P3UP18_LYOSH|nr:putative dienelactone hydrolase endo-1,3,1,4-beta-D-glucanase [Lyophyllum shimeji]